MREQGIKVVLTGEGADEMFAGYYSLIGARITALLSRGDLRAAWRIARDVYVADTAARARREVAAAEGRDGPCCTLGTVQCLKLLREEFDGLDLCPNGRLPRPEIGRAHV